MKRYIFKIVGVILIAILIFSATSHTAEASNIFDLKMNLSEFFNFFLASMANAMLTAAGWLLAIAGALLNMSINLTLKIKDFVDSAPGIFTTWKAIRDIAGLFFIFFLVYAAFMMIFGVSGGKYGYASILKSVVVAGVLINFSFFIAGIGIDVSNIVSVQLYNAIAPMNKLNSTNFSGSSQMSSWSRDAMDGGISSIFMQSLRITSLYDLSRMSGSTGQTSGVPQTTIVDTGKILLTAIFGVMIELIAAISFLGAALAFVARFVILIFLLAFSPIWFIGFIAPEIENYTKQWSTTYKSMLLFMPVYLLLMYFALNIISTTPLFTWDAAAVTASAPASAAGSGLIDTAYAAAPTASGSSWYAGLLSLGVNAVIILFLINVPLVAAMAIASKGGDKVGKFFGGIGKVFNGQKVTGKVSGTLGTWAIGGPAAAANKYLSNTKYGNKLISRDLRDATLGNLEKQKFGGDRSREDIMKLKKEVGKKEKEIERASTAKNLLRESKSGPIDEKRLKQVLDEMSDKEKIALGKDHLTNTMFIKHADKKTFDAIDKSDDISSEHKAEINTARINAFTNEIASATPNNQFIKNVMKNMSTEDIIDAVDSKGLLNKEAFIEHLTYNNVKDIVEKSLLTTEKRNELGEAIYHWRPTPSGTAGPVAGKQPEHKAFTYVDKNKSSFGIS